MASTMHLSLVLLCLVVTHAHGASRVLRWSDDSDVSPSTTSCPSINSGHINGNKLPVVHRLSPCSPLTGGSDRKRGNKPQLHEILHRDGLRLRYLSQVQAATTASGLSLRAKQNVVAGFPGMFQYTVLAGYGTPAQQVPMFFDTSSISSIRCKPCFSGTCNADEFDPSKSSSFHSLRCGSPDCGEDSCSPGGLCSVKYQNSTVVFGNGTDVMDTLTLSPSATFKNFVVTCFQLDNNLFPDDVGVGNIDLSLRRHSLTTRVLKSSPHGTAAFSYCLPADTDTHGFLTIAPALSDYSGHKGIKHVPLVTNPTRPNFYYVDLVAIAVNGKDLPFPPALFRENGTMIDSQAAFTYLHPTIYAALRKEFRKTMAQYPPAPAFGDLDTCYNFTSAGATIYLPSITFRFGNGVTMDLDDRQFMYFFREHLTDTFPFGCLAFAAAPFPSNYLGTQVQRTKEVVYDVRGGKVSFVPSRCGLR